MNLSIPILLDLNDYFLVKTKTISRVAIADIMDNEMLLRWYKKVLDNQASLKPLRGFGYFESEFSHGYVMASRRFNKIALEVIRFQLRLRKLDKSRNRSLYRLELFENTL